MVQILVIAVLLPVMHFYSMVVMLVGIEEAITVAFNFVNTKDTVADILSIHEKSIELIGLTV